MITAIWSRAQAERLADEAIREGATDAGVFVYQHRCGATAFGVSIVSPALDGEVVMETITTVRI